MFFRRFLPYTIISLCLFSCWPGKQLDAPAYYHNPPPADTSKLRFDGYYTVVSGFDYPVHNYAAINEIFFTTKNVIYVSDGVRAITDSSLFTCEFYKQLKPRNLGVYTVEGNTISAFAPVVVSMRGGANYWMYNLHFSGTIVNKDSIINWKAVPPFPKKMKRRRDIENSQNNGLFKERGLKFVQADSIKCLSL